MQKVNDIIKYVKEKKQENKIRNLRKEWMNDSLQN